MSALCVRTFASLLLLPALVLLVNCPGKSANPTVTVTMVSITVTPANSSVAAGNSQQFTATGNFSDGSTSNITSSVTWASSNSTAATITSIGLVKGVATGQS